MLPIVCFTINMDDFEEKKFEEIYYTYRNLLFSIAKNITENDEDAEDALQNTFFKISKNMNCIEEIHSKKTKSFLAVITKNSALDIMRKKQNVVPFENLKIEPHSERDLEEIVDKISYSDLCLCIKNLSSPYNEVLYFHFVYDYSVNEIALMLDRKISTVKMQLVRGKKILIKELEEMQHD